MVISKAFLSSSDRKTFEPYNGIVPYKQKLPPKETRTKFLFFLSSLAGFVLLKLERPSMRATKRYDKGMLVRIVTTLFFMYPSNTDIYIYAGFTRRVLSFL